MRVAMYVRVSTQRQAQAQTIEQQLERLSTYLQDQHWELLEEHIFRDDGFSGANLNRPGLDRLRDQIAAGRLDAVLLTDPDRLARNYVHQMVLLEEFQQHGCQVIFLDRPMSQDPHDQLLLQIRGAVAEYERTLIADRMRRGRQSKYRAGALLPWTIPPYGYQVDPERPRDPALIRIDESQATVVREIFAYFLQEASSLYSLIQHLFSLGIQSPQGHVYWSTDTTRSILTNPVYTGKVFAGRTHSGPPCQRLSALRPVGKPGYQREPVPVEEWICVADIPAIIDQEQFEQVKEKLAFNQRTATRHNTVHQYLLRAMVSCGICHLSCSGRHLPPHHTYYLCAGKDSRVYSHLEERCPSRYIPSDQLDDLVWEDLCLVLTHPDMIIDALQRAHSGAWLPQELQARRENLRQGQNALQNQLDRLTEAYLASVIPLQEYQKRRVQIEHRQKALTEQEKQLFQQVDRQKQMAGWSASIEAFSQKVQVGLENATFEQKRKLIELLIDRVVVTNDAVEIRYVFPLSPESQHIRFCHLRKDYFHGSSAALVLDDLPVQKLAQQHPGGLLPLPFLPPAKIGLWEQRWSYDFRWMRGGGKSI
jgi:site-specific DNA recombinase